MDCSQSRAKWGQSARTTLFVVCLGIASVGYPQGSVVFVEPDDYASGTVLNHVVPQVSLITAGNDNLPISPTPIDITATDDALGLFTNSLRVFGHGNIPFLNDIRRLRMDFAGLVSDVSIDFAGSWPLGPEIGRLEVFNLQNERIGGISASLLEGQTRTLTIDHATPDIAWAVAWSDGLSYGRFDHLVFSAPVPEPASVALWAAGAALLALCAWRKRRCVDS
jgi:hypothetical protein